MRYPRADWAASVPWAGVTGKPESLDQVNVDLSDIRAQLQALANAVNSIDQGAIQQFISKDVLTTIGTLEPFQSYTEVFAVSGIRKNSPLMVNFLEENIWLMCSGQCAESGNVRVTILNSGPSFIRPGTITFRITYLANA